LRATGFGHLDADTLAEKGEMLLVIYFHLFSTKMVAEMWATDSL
jgi:hypothetical protein